MKILNVEQIRAADAYTIRHEPIASIDLMESASLAIVEAFVDLPIVKTPIRVICGCGNNAGDGLAIARLLHERNFEVEAWILDLGSEGSEDFRINRQRWSTIGSTVMIRDVADLPGQDDAVDFVAEDVDPVGKRKTRREGLPGEGREAIIE